MVYVHFYCAPHQRTNYHNPYHLPYLIKMLNSACVFASWNGGLSAQSSYMRHPNDQMSDFES